MSFNLNNSPPPTSCRRLPAVRCQYRPGLCESIANLNFEAARSTSKILLPHKALLGAKDAKVPCPSRLPGQPNVEKAVAYSKSVYEISAENPATDDQMVDPSSAISRRHCQPARKAAKSAPAGSDWPSPLSRAPLPPPTSALTTCARLLSKWRHRPEHIATPPAPRPRLPRRPPPSNFPAPPLSANRSLFGRLFLHLWAVRTHESHCISASADSPSRRPPCSTAVRPPARTAFIAPAHAAQNIVPRILVTARRKGRAVQTGLCPLRHRRAHRVASEPLHFAARRVPHHPRRPAPRLRDVRAADRKLPVAIDSFRSPSNRSSLMPRLREALQPATQ